MLMLASPSREAARARSPGRCGKFDLSYIRLCVAQTLVVQGLFRRGRIVHHEASHTISLCGDRLERQNVHFAVSQGLANLSESARSILQGVCLNRPGPDRSENAEFTLAVGGN
jgi:hypothetical protein